ncbi:methyl-accepting chemotaxis protein [Luteibacter yeojuensis]|uniref:Chemotaxis protein n=1 Tax=Luteibacter yeojuensis TaxID=345309 RepID=A0A0F3K7M0_9GAMM|nr:methyl-accepting chemotaxis protein [Luteibacter yeojuensis]KJV27208.1 chemotaxis protein [Luteibacter yeojuensis]
MKKLKLKIPALTVRGRLYGVLGLLTAMLLGGAAVGLGAMYFQNEGMRQIYEEELAPSEMLSRVNTNSLMSFIVLGEAATKVKEADQVKQKIAEFEKYQAEMNKLKADFAKLPMSPDIKKLYDKWQATNEDYAQAKADMVDALNQHDEGATDVLELQVRPLLMDRQTQLGKLIEAKRDEAAAIYAKQAAQYKTIRALSIGSLAIGLVFCLIIAALVVRGIIGTLAKTVAVAHEIAEGKLGHDIQVTRSDELGQLQAAFKAMDERLAAIVTEVRHGSGSVSTAAQQISRGNDDLSQRTQEQASSLEETASSMEEMTSTVKQNAENASHANQLARGAREQAEKGGEVVAQTVVAMREINSSSKKISDIVSLIDEIAFQTNLLALNAAVEAARAGEQGRGFAVVATEVRNLAQRSAGAAKEIKGLINDSANKVKAGSELVDQSGKALAEIVDSVKKVTDIVAEIAAASSEQSAGIDQVNHAVLQMDEMTQQNAALVEESAAAARAMHEQASELSRQVAFFKVGGAAAAAVAASRKDPTQQEMETVFAAVRSQPAARTQRPAEPAGDAGVWKEF